MGEFDDDAGFEGGWADELGGGCYGGCGVEGAAEPCAAYDFGDVEDADEPGLQDEHGEGYDEDEGSDVGEFLFVAFDGAAGGNGGRDAADGDG